MIAGRLFAVLLTAGVGATVECLLRYDSGVFAKTELLQHLGRAWIFGPSAGMVGIALLYLLGRVRTKDGFDPGSILSIAIVFLCGFVWDPLLHGIPTYIDQILHGRQAVAAETTLAGTPSPEEALAAAAVLIESAAVLPSPTRAGELIDTAQRTAVAQAARPIDRATVDAFARFTAKASEAGLVEPVGKVAEALARGGDENALDSADQQQLRVEALQAIARETPPDRRVVIAPRIGAAQEILQQRIRGRIERVSPESAVPAPP